MEGQSQVKSSDQTARVETSASHTESFATLESTSDAARIIAELESLQNVADVQNSIAAFEKICRTVEGNGEQQKILGKAGVCKLVANVLNANIAALEVCTNNSYSTHSFINTFA